MSDLPSYLRRGSLALVLVGVGGFGADYAYNVGLSRLLEAHAYGDYKVAHAFVVFFGSAVLLGGDRAAPKALAGPLARGQSDLYFLELLGDEAEVGCYAAAATTAHFLVLVQTTVVGLMAPLASTAIEEGREASEATRRQGQRLMLAGLLPAVALLALAGRPILSLFGTGYGQALTEFHLLLVGNFAWAAASTAITLSLAGLAVEVARRRPGKGSH